MSDSSPAVRWCSWHQCEHPVEEFGFKNRARGTRQSKCKAGQREYSSQHHAANRESRLVQVKARRDATRAELTQIVHAAKAAASCSVCDTADTELWAFGGETPLWELVRREASKETLQAALDSGHIRWLCATCRKARLGDLRRDVSPKGRAKTIKSVVRERCAAGEATVSELLLAVAETSIPTTRETMWVLLPQMVADGDLARVRRGVFIAVS